MERIVLKGATHYEGATIWEYDHAVAEHVPVHRLGGDGAGLRIPESGLKICVASDVAGTGNDQNFAVIKQRDVDRIDRHRIGKGLPLTNAGGLREEGWCNASDAKEKQTQREKQTGG